MNTPIAFGQMGAGDQLLIQSHEDTGLDLTVNSDAETTPYLNFLTVTINDVQGDHDFVVGRSALLFTADLGDVSVERAVEHFRGDMECTSIGEGYWVCLMQGRSVGILRVRSITIQK